MLFRNISVEIYGKLMQSGLNREENVIDWITTPPEMSISQSPEHVTLHGRRDFAMWLSYGRWDGELTLGYYSGPSVITMVPMRGEEGSSEPEIGNATMKASSWVTWGRGHTPRMTSRTEKGKETDSPLEVLKEI